MVEKVVLFTFALKRLWMTVPTLFFLTVGIFLMVKAIPGDPAQIKLGERASPEVLERFRKEMWLDRPIYMQYGRYMGQIIFEGDLGRSLISQDSINDIIAEKFPATMELAAAAMLIAICFGVPLGLLGAYKPGSFLDFGSMGLAVLGVSMPLFWLGLILVWLFGLVWPLFPISGRLGIEHYYEPVSGFLLWDALWEGDFEMFRNALWHLCLPAVTLATIPAAFLARITRSSMMEVSKQDWMRTAHAKGLSRIHVYVKHGLKNAMIPILTVMGLQFGMLLGGAMITETIFSWPGMGSWILSSVESRDVNAIEAGVLVGAVSFVIVNLIVDLLYHFIDPRIRPT